jgi:antitoxin YefM
MQDVSYSEARESFVAVLDRVEADTGVTLILWRHTQSALVLSLDTCNSLKETDGGPGGSANQQSSFTC